MEETSFPRGRPVVAEAESKPKRKEKRKKKTQTTTTTPDFLFGSSGGGEDVITQKKKQRKEQQQMQQQTGTIAASKSMLPMGGGAVTSKGFIEPLSFQKLSAGFKMLAVLKEVHYAGGDGDSSGSSSIAIFSLPNLWTAYMILEDESTLSLGAVGTFYTVKIVKAVQESTRKGAPPQRRIQVTCAPAALNPVDVHVPGLTVTGTVQSLQDHGVLIDLGLKRRGFLPYSEIQGNYSLTTTTANDDEKTTHQLVVGRILQLAVSSKLDSSNKVAVVPLTLPETSATVTPQATYRPALNELQPGTLVRNVTVEQVLRNGLAVSFWGSGVFRGAIEVSHLPCRYIPDTRHENTAWKDLFKTATQISAARILAVDAATKIVRLTLLPHLLELQHPSLLPGIGAVVPDCTVLRIDPGVGALLALPKKTSSTATEDEEDERDEDEAEDMDDTEQDEKENKKKPLFKPISTDEAYQEACRTQAVYVHISKSMDSDGSVKIPDAVFAKQFAPSTKHDVRIISTSNLVEGIASGATAASILKAHVLTHADICPGKVYKQVPVCMQLENGSVLVDFGMGIRGLIPAVQLFDQAVSSEYRNKMRKVKYSVGAKVDVRVLSVDTDTKKCMLTAKKSLVKAQDDEIISSFDGIKIGQKAIGFVSNVVDDGLFVTFFNGVFGRVTARSLAAELGVENHKENYSRGDVVQCRVVNLKKRTKRNSRRWQQQNDNDEMDIDDENQGNNNRRCYHELTLSLCLDTLDEDGASDDRTPVKNPPEKRVHLHAGAVLPLKSLRVVELVPGKTKADGFVPGYAIVSIRSKHMVGEAEAATMPPYMECKLPYDQLLDCYLEDDLENSTRLDKLAESMLTIGKKINSKAIVLTDPKKSNSEYAGGTGHLVVLSIRPRLVETAQAQLNDNRKQKTDSDEEIVLPGPNTHFFTGALVQGYVAQVHPKFGSFVRFLDGMTGLVPKTKGGLHLKLYSTVVVQVFSVDDRVQPPKISLGLTKSRDDLSSKGLANNISDAEVGLSPIKCCDIIKEAEIVKLEFHRATLKILDDDWSGDKSIRARIHCAMTESTPLPREGKLSAASSEQRITAFHPFHKWNVGEKLSKLEVVSVQRQGRSWCVEVTNRKTSEGGEIVIVDERKPLTPGDRVSGIVTTVVSNQGLWLQLTPEVSAFAPGLELSEDVNVLNNLASHFPLGSRLQCVVMDRVAWERTRSKYHCRGRSHGKEEPKSEIPVVSVLGLGSDCKVSKPQRGDMIVGRVDRSLPSASGPDLMLDLRGGFVGRCCVTELEEVDDWVNFPLGRSEEDHESEIDKMDIDDLDAKAEKGDEDDDEAETSDSEDVPFAHGMFVQCRVLAGTPSKPMVEVSLRCSRIEGDIDEDEPPEQGDTVHAYVVETNRTGCFLRLGRQIGGRAMLKELCDGFLPDPVASFPMGRLVVGKIKEIRPLERKSGCIKMTADVDMRESTLMEESEALLKFDDVEIGGKYKGNVTRIEDYGVFVRLANSELSGLVHMSECSDKYIKSLTDLYDPGDLVKVLVLKKNADKKQLGFSMKASHFEGDENSDDDSSIEEESVQEETKPVSLLGIDDAELDSDDENYASKLASLIQSNTSGEQTVPTDEENDSNEDDSSDSSSGSDSNSAESSDSEEEEEEDGKTSHTLDTNVGFDWSGASGLTKQTKDSDASSSDSSEDEEDEEDAHKSSHKSRKKQAQRRLEEQEISRRETALADGTADENPETAGDFERLLAGDPNSSEIWIRYMAFHLTLANVQAAREIANRAFERIEFRQEKEKLNVWCALLTLELKYGSEEALQKTLDRACQHNNPKQVYLRMCEMLEKQASSPDSIRNTDEMFAKMCKKFKDKKTVWIAHMEYLLKHGRQEEAFALSKRALLSLKPHKHVETMSKFAQLVFQYGSAEKARTIFDGLLLKYPKRLDLFFVYSDKEVKHGEIDVARSLFARVANPHDETLKLKLSDKQMKRFFKKWFSFEENHGTDETKERVKDAARDFVERTS